MLIFGWIGGIINAFHVLPQILEIFRTKSVKNISFFSLVVKLISAITYTIHGVMIQDSPLIFMTGLIVFEYSFILAQYKYYKKTDKCDANTAESVSLTTITQNMHKDPPV